MGKPKSKKLCKVKKAGTRVTYIWSISKGQTIPNKPRVREEQTLNSSWVPLRRSRWRKWPPNIANGFVM